MTLEVYYCLYGTFTSLYTEDLDIGDFTDVEVLYDGKYKFDGFMKVEEAKGEDFTYSVKPLQGERNIVLYVALPENAETDTKDIQINISVSEKSDSMFDTQEPHTIVTLNSSDFLD
jgi:hypothetical protein